MEFRINQIRLNFPFATFAKSFATFAVEDFLTLILLFSLFSNKSIAQEVHLSEIITSIAEELASEESDPESIEMYVERLSELSEDPVNLNSADESELSRLFFLTDFQIKALADYSRSAGRIFSIYEIPNITGFNRETAEMVIPFITLEEIIGAEQPGDYISNTFLSNVTYNTSAQDSTYPGSPDKLLSRYKFTSGTFSGGFTMEKDQGEKLFPGRPGMPDFFSANLEYTGRGFVRKLIIGDFSARFGEGLGINTGWKSGLFLTAPGYMSSKNEVRKYTSADENNFFRGTAATFAFRSLSLTVFYSQNKIDAVPDTGSGIKSLYTAGLHNSVTLLQRKDILTDIASGINLTYNFKSIRAGILWTEDRFSHPFVITPGDPENIFDFSGRRNSNYSFYYNSLINRILFFGEISFSKNLRHALLQGISLRLSDRLIVNALFRNYENGYSSFHGHGPGSSTWNENSILGNFTFETARHLFLSAGCDLRYFPWLKYRCNSPSYGIRQEVRLKYLPVENLSGELLYNYRFSMTDSEERGIPSQKEFKSSQLRGTLRYAPIENLTFATRIDYKYVMSTGDKGMLLSQDVAYVLRKVPLSFWYRYCIFRTGSWDSRLYLYENDLLYSFSIPALSGEGIRN